jgi:2-polyprenyl-3-methyl-5-hydroxy-6-metoxy-1,4-benzoquinol methylase
MKLVKNNSIGEIIQVRNSFRHEVCPCCSSERIKFIGIFDYKNIKKFSTSDVSFSICPELWSCNDCLSWFVQNSIPEKEAQHLYSIGSAGDRWIDKSFTKSKTKKTVEFFDKILLPGKKVLDIGANTGEFLDFAKQKGCDTYGLEYSEKSRATMIEKGHKTYASFSDIDETFDLITGFDLIEHVYNIKKFIISCENNLINNGRLVFLTGDNTSYPAQKTLQNWWYVQFPEHVVFPSKKYFTELDNFNLELFLRTFAAKSHQLNINYRNISLIIKNILKFFKNKPFNGQPTLVYDHALIVLVKKPSKEDAR